MLSLPHYLDKSLCDGMHTSVCGVKSDGRSPYSPFNKRNCIAAYIEIAVMINTTPKGPKVLMMRLRQKMGKIMDICATGHVPIVQDTPTLMDIGLLAWCVSTLIPGFHWACVYDITCAMLFCLILHDTADPTESIAEAE